MIAHVHSQLQMSTLYKYFKSFNAQHLAQWPVISNYRLCHLPPIFNLPDQMSAFKDVMESVPITTAYISKAHASTILVGGDQPIEDDNVSRMTKGTLEPDLDSQGDSAGSCSG